MKKTLVLAAIAGIALSSCKKDRTCTCTSSTISRTSTQPGYTYTPDAPTVNKTTYKKVKKKNVLVQTCVSYDDTYSYNYTSGSQDYVMTVNSKKECELK